MQRQFDLDKLRAGDLTEFELLFRFMYPKLKSLGKRYVSEDVAEDLLQDTFETYWTQKEFLEIRSVESYLFKSMQNKTLNYIKRQGVEESYLSYSKLAQSHLEYLQANEENYALKRMTSSELRDCIDKKLEELPIRMQEAFRLYYFDQMSKQEIARAMNITSRTVETHLYQALKYLKNNVTNKEAFLTISSLLTFFNNTPYV